jgi:hypothetical protein
MNALIILVTKYLLYPIIIGVISTVCYVLIFDKLFKHVILPWYFSRKYKSTLIDGVWAGKTSHYNFDVNIKQTGDRVKGDMIVTNLSLPDSEGKVVEEGSNSYTFEGEIKDGFLRIIHKEKDRNSFGFGCLMFQIAGGGKTLNGSCLYVDEGTNRYSIETELGIRLLRKTI